MRRSLLALVLVGCADVRDDDAMPTGVTVADGETTPVDGTAAETMTQSFDANGPGGLLPPPACAAVMPGSGGSLGDLDFSYIWIANSAQGTVSKIDTESAVEVARYFTSEMEGDGDPSRTAVNPAGDVAVTSRAGAVTKIAAFVDRCEDFNDNGVIDTSSGPDDVLAWGTDECVRWSVGLPGGGGSPNNHQGPRPTGWDAGTAEDPCSRLWVGWYEQGNNRGRFRRLEGERGETLDEVTVDGWDLAQTGKNWGPYGGAVDAGGDLWVIGWGGPLVRIDGETLAVDRWEAPEGTHPYGIALDGNGEPWTSGMAGDVLHFDPVAGTWTTAVMLDTGAGPRILRGLAIDRDGVAWVAANSPCGLVSMDVATHGLISDAVELPGCEMPVGVGVDVAGRVWVVDSVAGVGFRRDVGGEVVRTEGLVAPYTYSDMTGAGLELVLNPAG